MFDKLEAVEKRYEEITKMISDPEVIANQSEWQKLMKEHASIEEIVLKYREYKKTKQTMEEAEEMMQDKELKELAEAEFYEAKEKLPKIKGSLDNDCLIVGSDQVWNPSYLKNTPYLLDGYDDCKRISYAASVGVDSLTKEQANSFEKALKHYRAISVREQSAKDFLQPLTNTDIKVVLDPTLLLDRATYEQIEKRPKDIGENESYVLCYILGDENGKVAINEFATQNKCRIIMFSDKTGSNYGVEEFLYLIHHAKLICTDSFHACVFSFIFERPFVVFKRKGKSNRMYSRLEHFLKVFRLGGREFNSDSITEKNLLVDYTVGKRILEQKREKSTEFLRKALELSDESR